MQLTWRLSNVRYGYCVMQVSTDSFRSIFAAANYSELLISAFRLFDTYTHCSNRCGNNLAFLLDSIFTEARGTDDSFRCLRYPIISITVYGLFWLSVLCCVIQIFADF